MWAQVNDSLPKKVRKVEKPSRYHLKPKKKHHQGCPLTPHTHDTINCGRAHHLCAVPPDTASPQISKHPSNHQAVPFSVKVMKD